MRVYRNIAWFLPAIALISGCVTTGSRQLETVVTARLRKRATELLGPDGPDGLVARVQAGQIDPYSAADELLGPLGA